MGRVDELYLPIKLNKSLLYFNLVNYKASTTLDSSDEFELERTLAFIEMKYSRPPDLLKCQPPIFLEITGHATHPSWPMRLWLTICNLKSEITLSLVLEAKCTEAI